MIVRGRRFRSTPPRGLRRLDYLRPEAAVALFGRAAAQGALRAELAEGR